MSDDYSDWKEAPEIPPHLDYLSVFGEEEIRAALALILPPEDAERIASEVCAIPTEDRPGYGWTEWAVDLLARSTPSVLEKVKRFFGGSDDDWKQRGLWIASSREQGHSFGWDIDDVVVQ